jgi:hypothetical protein
VLALSIEAVPLKVCNNFGSSISGLDEVKGLWMVYTPKVVFNGMGHCGMCKGVGNNVVG